VEKFRQICVYTILTDGKSQEFCGKSATGLLTELQNNARMRFCKFL